MSYTPVDFANGWAQWTKELEFADSSPQAYAEHLERVHALEVQRALNRLIQSEIHGESTGEDYIREFENLAESKVGDTWVEQYLAPQDTPDLDLPEEDVEPEDGELDPILHN